MPVNTKTRILIVEDDVSVRLTISKLLNDQGYEVSTSSDGFDALLHLREEIPELILSDLNMPQMSGFELLSVVRRRFPEILVVASSGAYDSSEIPNGVLADAFYAKGHESAADLLEPDQVGIEKPQARERSSLDSAEWERSQRQALCASDLHAMLAIFSIHGGPRTNRRSAKDIVYLLSARSNLHH